MTNETPHSGASDGFKNYLQSQLGPDLQLFQQFKTCKIFRENYDILHL